MKDLSQSLEKIDNRYDNTSQQEDISCSKAIKNRQSKTFIPQRSRSFPIKNTEKSLPQIPKQETTISHNSKLKILINQKNLLNKKHINGYLPDKHSDPASPREISPSAGKMDGGSYPSTRPDSKQKCFKKFQHFKNSILCCYEKTDYTSETLKSRSYTKEPTIQKNSKDSKDAKSQLKLVPEKINSYWSPKNSIISKNYACKNANITLDNKARSPIPEVVNISVKTAERRQVRKNTIDSILSHKAVKKSLSLIKNVGKKNHKNRKSINREDPNLNPCSTAKPRNKSRSKKYSKLLEISNNLFKIRNSTSPNIVRKSRMSLDEKGELGEILRQTRGGARRASFDLSVMSSSSRFNFSWYDNSKYGVFPKHQRKTIFRITEPENIAGRAPSLKLDDRQMPENFFTFSNIPNKSSLISEDKINSRLTKTFQEVRAPLRRVKTTDIWTDKDDKYAEDIKTFFWCEDGRGKIGNESPVMQYTYSNRFMGINKYSPYHKNNSSVSEMNKAISEKIDTILEFEKDSVFANKINKTFGSSTNRKRNSEKNHYSSLTGGKAHGIISNLSSSQIQKNDRKRWVSHDQELSGSSDSMSPSSSGSSSPMIPGPEPFKIKTVSKSRVYKHTGADLASSSYFKVAGAHANNRKYKYVHLLEKFDNKLSKSISLTKTPSNSKEYELCFKLENRKPALRNTIQIGERISYKKFLYKSHSIEYINGSKGNLETKLRNSNSLYLSDDGSKVSFRTEINSPTFDSILVPRFNSCEFVFSSSDSLNRDNSCSDTVFEFSEHSPNMYQKLCLAKKNWEGKKEPVILDDVQGKTRKALPANIHVYLSKDTQGIQETKEFRGNNQDLVNSFITEYVPLR